MKNFFSKILLVALMAVFAGALTGCNPEPQQKPFSVTFKGFGPGYVSLHVTLPSPTKVAYTISEKPIPVTETLLNMTGTKTTFYTEGEYQLLDYPIEENKSYYVYLVGLLGESFSQLYTYEFQTGEFVFDQLATVVGLFPDGYKMHLKMPSSVVAADKGKPGSTAIRFSHCNIMMYNLRRESSDDYEFLLWNGGNYVRKDTTLVYNDASNYGQVGFDANEDGVTDENDKGMLWDPIAPGEPIVFIAGEFEHMAEPEGLSKDENHVVNGFFFPAGWDAGYYLPCVDSTKYWSVYAGTKTKGAGVVTDIDKTSDIDQAWTGAFQRKIFRARVPAVLDAKINVRVEDLRSVDATVLIEPDENIHRYLFTILDEASYQYLLKLIDYKEEYIQWAITSYFAMMEFGALEVSPGAGEITAPIASIALSKFFNSVPSDTKYHVLVTGMSGDIGSPQCFYHHTFSTPAKTKDYGPDIEVTALPEMSTPYAAAFNVKCTETPENPLVSCYYGANYYKDWVLEVNGGSSYEALGQTTPFTEEEMEQICSEDGYTMYIPSIDGAKTRLVVVGWNDENISNGVDTYEDVLAHPAVDDCVTPYAEAEDLSVNPLLDPLSSNNYTPLLNGDWTMTATVINNGKTEIQKSKVTIKNALVEGVDYPSHLPDSVLKLYKEVTKMTDDEIRGYFDEFKTLAGIYNEKRLRNQNKLVLEGWLNHPADTTGRLNLMTPWDMFVSREVSTVDVESMFSEYGPKVFIKVGKDANGKDSLAVTANKYFASPVANWSVPFYLAGYANRETNNTMFYWGTATEFQAPLEFPVVLSEDKNTITIKGYQANGETYYPNLIGEDYSIMTGTVYILDYPIVSDVVLTRGWDGGKTVDQTAATKSASWGMRAFPVRPDGKPTLGKYGKRTRFEKPETTRKIDYEFRSYDQIMESLEKYKTNR